MSRPGTDHKTDRRANRAMRLVTGSAAVIVLGAWLCGCSDMYLDRRDSVALGAGDSIAANKLQEMVDPWPAESGNRNIAFNGQKMQKAVQRYRTDKVLDPTDPTSIISTNQPGQSVTQNNVNAGGSNGSTGGNGGNGGNSSGSGTSGQ